MKIRCYLREHRYVLYVTQKALDREKGEVHETGQVSDQQKKKFKEHSEINPFGYI